MKLSKKSIVILFLLLSQSLYASEVNTSRFSEMIKPYQGKVVYLDFWASWCAPCRKSFPWMNELKNKFSSDQFMVVSVNLDADKELAEKFLSQIPANFPIIYDPKGELASEMKVKGMPSSFLISAEGKIISAHMGFTEKKKIRYEQEIKQSLKGNQHGDN